MESFDLLEDVTGCSDSVMSKHLGARLRRNTLRYCNISSLVGCHPAWYGDWVNTFAPPAPYQYPILIDPADIDFMGHVNNASYLKWVQDAVIDHWRALAPAEDVARHLWVALKHEITYRRPTFANDLPIAHVVLEKVQGARAMYQTVIKRGEVVLAEVTSSWCCLDAVTMKPARLARDLIERFLPSPVE